MKKLLIYAPLIILMISVLACQATTFSARRTIRGSGNVIEEKRDAAGVSSVELAMNGTLYIELGQQEELRIDADDNLLEYIRTVVQGGRLRIVKTQNVSFEDASSIKYYLTVKDLRAVQVSSSGDIEITNIEVDSFDIKINSSGDVRVDEVRVDKLLVDIVSSGDVSIGELYSDQLDVEISSSGDFEVLAGVVNTQKISIRSSGDYLATNLSSDNANVFLGSNGKARIRVAERLDARLNSSGDLYYIGSPKIYATENSSGEIYQISE